MARLSSGESEAVAVYNEHVQVISEIKKSQWQIIYYLILLYGGIIALHEEIQKALPVENRCLFAFLMPLTIWALGAWVQCRLHCAVTKRRNRIKDGRAKLSKMAQSIFGEPAPTASFFTKDFDVPVLGIGSTFIAALICWSLLSGR